MTTKTAAIRYARALFDVARRENADLDTIDRDLAAFVALFDQHPALEKVLLSPAVPMSKKRAAVAELASRMSVVPIVSKLMVLLAERDRLILLPDLLSSYRERVLAHRNIVRAELTTAIPLADGEAHAIEQRLARATGRTVTLSTKVDTAIIGGLVAKVGSTIYDASVTRQLQKMKDRLAESV
jgi:F-type H+-transporting ATPase subunit delta